jgi:DNA modification methylase
MGVEIPEVEIVDEEPEYVDGETEPDAVPEIAEDEKPVSVRGKVYQLGEHRLMCGDSTAVEDVAKLMQGEKADLALTDPPYGISVVQNSTVGGSGVLHFGTVKGKNIVAASKYRPIANDDTTDVAKENFKILQEISVNQIIFGGNYFTDFLPPKACWVVWDKENTGNFADVELAWTSFDKGAKLYHWMWNGLARKGDRKTEGKSRVHPTQKPVGLMCEIMRDFECLTVVDCFGGSGSTLIACEQLNRKCRMMELDEHYCDVIRKRWAEFVHGEGCDWQELTPEVEK